MKASNGQLAEPHLNLRAWQFVKAGLGYRDVVEAETVAFLGAHGEDILKKSNVRKGSQRPIFQFWHF